MHNQGSDAGRSIPDGHGHFQALLMSHRLWLVLGIRFASCLWNYHWLRTVRVGLLVPINLHDKASKVG